MSGQSGTVPLFATPFASVNTGENCDFNARLASLKAADVAYLQHRDLPNEPKKSPVSNETAEISHTFIEPGKE